MDAAVHLAEQVVRAASREGSPRPFLVGVAGPVAVGKSVLARAVASAVESRGRRVAVVSTDGFLLPNAVLAGRGLDARKGFPESYDTAGLEAFVSDLRSGRAQVLVPVYSHEHYDVVDGEVQVVRDADVVIVEGVNALQPPLAAHLDLAIYVDADEEDVFRWYASRFEALRAGDVDAHPFYRRLAALADDDLQVLARLVWDEVNGRNLREHILPSRGRADLVVGKRADHQIESIRPSVP
jgi:type I pantothenate kinase